MHTHYVPGAWNVICDRCGFERKSFELRKEWTGLMVCADTCWEARHPQDFIRVPKEEIAPPWTRPEPADVFISVSYPLEDENGNFLFDENGNLIYA